MNINDIVYVVYRSGCEARKVKLLSEFVKGANRMQGLNGKAQFLMQYDLKNGWKPYKDRHGKTKGIYRVSKKNLYATWEEAQAIIKIRLQLEIEKQSKYVKQLNEKIMHYQQSCAESIDLLEKLKRLNIKEHFAENNENSDEKYTSPFTGLELQES